MQGANDNLRPIRRLTEADIPAALALSGEAHWNQVADDWRLFLELGQPVALETAEGRLVATAASLPHGPRLAWISMVLVTADWRRRGLATRLMMHAIETVEGGGRVPGLDATPAGREVYRPLGFEELFALTRWRGTVAGVDAPVRAAVRPLADTDMALAADLDRRALGGERPVLLARLRARRPDLALWADDGAGNRGFCLARPGRTATQIGPVVAQSETVALALVGRALALLAGETVLVDLADHQVAVGGLLKAAGMTAERPFYRMTRGEPPAFQRDLFVAAAGPELA